MVGDDVCHGLGVGGRAGTAAPNGVVHLCQFVGDSIGNVGTGGGSAVRAENYAILEVDCHAVFDEKLSRMVRPEAPVYSHRGSQAAQWISLLEE